MRVGSDAHHVRLREKTCFHRRRGHEVCKKHRCLITPDASPRDRRAVKCAGSEDAVVSHEILHFEPQMLMDFLQTAMATGCVLCTLLAIGCGVLDRFNGD